MANTVGQIATAVHFNTVGSKVNKVFGDIYSTAAVTDTNRVNTHKFGWGSATNVVANASDIITAEKLQGLVEKTNISINHTDITDSVLVFAVPTNRTSISSGTLVRAEDLNKVDDKFSPVLDNNKHLTIDATNASAVIAPSSGYGRTTTWDYRLQGEHKFEGANYNKARYFFNAGGQLRLSLNMTGGSTAGYYNWSDVINEMGVLNFNWDTVTQSIAKTSGTSEGKGFYDLTANYGVGSDTNTNEGLLFTSSGVTIGRKVGTYGSTYGYGYGYITGAGNFPEWADPAINSSGGGGGYGYGYSGIYVSAYGIYSSYQQLKFRIYGKYINNGAGVQFKIILDDTTHANVIDGSITPTISYLMPDTLTQGTTSLDVSPDPTFSIVNDFTSSDDS